jgi:hypothetical protein
VKARFFRSDAMSGTYGEIEDHIVEAEWFQLTYHDLRTAPDGEFVANFDQYDEAWYIKGVPFSDVVIFNEEVAA